MGNKCPKHVWKSLYVRFKKPIHGKIILKGSRFEYDYGGMDFQLCVRCGKIEGEAGWIPGSNRMSR